MIVTSNIARLTDSYVTTTVEHNFGIPRLNTVGQVDSNLNVIEQVTVSIGSSVTFDYTYETTDMEGVKSSVTESRTESTSSQFFVSLNTSGISTFQAYDDLEEDTVLQWAFDADSEGQKAKHMDANETIVLTAKDKLLNPLNYKKGSPVTPWKKRADEASLNRRMITEPLKSVEEEKEES